MHSTRTVPSGSSIAAFLLPALLLWAPLGAQEPVQEPPGEEHEEPLPERPPGPDLRPERIVDPAAVEEHFTVVALRVSRTQRDVPTEVIADSIAAQGAAVIAPICDILVARRVPSLETDQLEQLLSRPQRDILLATLQRLPRADVLQRMRRRCANSSELPERVAWLEVLGALGDARSLPRMYELVLEDREEELPDIMEEAFQKALGDVLRRDPKAYGLLGMRLRNERQVLLPAAIFALGDAGDTLGLELLDEILNFFPDQAPLCASQVGRLGRSTSPAINHQLAERLRWMLDPNRIESCRAALLALGVLRDHEALPAMIGFLESEHAGLRANALWALQRATDLTLTGDAETWRRWFDWELAWFERDYAGVRSRLSLSDPAQVASALKEIGERHIRRDVLALEVLEVLDREDPELRLMACCTLERLDEPLAVPALIEMLDDPDSCCVAAARQALVALTGRDLPPERSVWAETLTP